MTDLSALKLVEKDGEARFEVRAKPRAKRSGILGVRDGALDVAIAAPPVDGAANAELVKLIARALDVSLSSVRLVRGESARSKLLAVSGLAADDVRARLSAQIAAR